LRPGRLLDPAREAGTGYLWLAHGLPLVPPRSLEAA
jgi:hypothetical protein